MLRSYTHEKLDELIYTAKPLLDQMHEIVFCKNVDYEYTYCNNKLVDFSRLRRSDLLVGKNDYGLPWAESADTYREIDKGILNGEKKKIIIKVKVANGEYRSAIQNKAPIIDWGTHKSVGIMVTMTEIHDATMNHLIWSMKTRDQQIAPHEIIKNTQYYFENYHNCHLTNRESECLFYVLRGMTVKLIASIMKISPKTVEKFIEKLKIKFNCQHKYELIDKAMMAGMMNVIPPVIDPNKIRFLD